MAQSQSNKVKPTEGLLWNTYIPNAAKAVGNYLTKGWQTPAQTSAQGGQTITGQPLPKPATSGLSLADYNKSTQASNPGLFKPKASTATQTTQPDAKASYTGGESMPAVGTSAYVQSQKLAQSNNGTTIVNTTGNTTGNTGSNTGSATGFKYDSKGNKVFIDANGNPVSDQNAGYKNVYGDTTGVPGYWQSTVGKLANTAPATGATTAISGLQDIAQNQTPAVTEAQKQYNQFAKASPFLLSDVANNPNVAAEVSVGRGQALGQTLSAEQQALAANVANALAGQGQQITAGQQAGGLANTAQQNVLGAQGAAVGATQPQAGAAFFGSPETGGVVGQGVGGTGNNLIDNAVSNAVGMIRSGASTSDALATLSSLGAPAQQALINQMRQYDPNWNITSSNAIAQQNMAQGQQYQGRAAELNTNLTQMKNVTTPILDLINKAGLNQQDNPFFNASINEYSSQLKDPAAQASLRSGMAEIKTYVSNILGAGGDLTPTAVTDLVNSFDPQNFTAAQLESFLDNMNTYGQARLQGFQQTSQQSYGGAQGVTGSPASAFNTANVTTPNPPASVTTENPVGQALVGGGMRALGGIEGLISGLASKVLSR